MPIHDWSRVRAGKFHHFHNSWIYKISDRLNDGLLPPGFYAAGEQIAREVEPDVLTFTAAPVEAPPSWRGDASVLAVEEHPPRVSFHVESEEAMLLCKQDRLVVHALDGDRVVAILEVVSLANKSSRHGIERFLYKAAAAIRQGIHLLIIDLYPPGSSDPQGMHVALWDHLFGVQSVPADIGSRPLTLASYRAAPIVRAYVEPMAVGSPLPDMPLFLHPDWYVNVPLEETYMEAWKGLPEPWRQQLAS